MREQIVTFQGLDTEASPTERPGALLQVATNVRLDQQGVIQPRRGFTRTSAFNSATRDVVALAGFRTAGGAYETAFAATSSTDGFLYRPASATTATTLYTGSSGDKRPRLCVHNQRLYYVDGWRPMQRWDGVASATVSAGITGPSTAAGAWAPTPTTAAGNCTAGSHKFRYRYLDSTTGYVSEPSNEYVATVVAGSQQLTFAINTSGSGNIIRSSDTKVDKVVVEMTLAGGTRFYKAAEGIQSASTIVVSVSDVTLANQPPPWPDTGTLDAGVHYPPPIASHVYSFRGRLWLFGQVVHSLGTVTTSNGSASVTGSSTDFTAACALPSAPIGTNRVVRRFKVAGDAVDYEVASTGGATALTLSSNYAGTGGAGQSYSIYSRDRSIFYSAPGYPEAFPPFNYVLGPDSGAITGMIGHQNALMFFTVNGMERFVWTNDPGADGVKRMIPTQRGLCVHECAVNVEEVLYGLDRRGFWRYDGEVPRQISRQIETQIARINWTYESTFHACFYPKLRAIRWWVALDSDTKPFSYFQLDVDTGTWTTGSRGTLADGAGVGATALIPTSSGMEVYAGSTLVGSWNALYYDDKGTTDGAEACTPQQGTVGTGGTSTTTRLYLSGVTLPSGTATLHGTPVYVDGYAARVVSTHQQSPAYVDLTVALASVPPVGTRVHLGYIPVEFKTKEFRAPKNMKHAGRYLHVHYVPVTVETGEVSRIRVRVYRDFSSTQVDYESGLYASLAGVTFDVDSGDWFVDMTHADGVVKIPLAAGTAQVTSVEIEQLDAGAPFKILGLSIDGVDLEAVT